jgi:uncharacterized protein (TIGR00369 family)
LTDLSAMGQAVLAAQPFSQLVGIEMTKFTTGETELRVPLRGEHMQHVGFVHGGVLASLADVALTFAGAAALGGAAVITSEIKINYVRPALGGELIARAVALSAGRSQSVVRCEIYVLQDGVEKLCAAGQGTIVARDNAPKARQE